MPKKQKGGDNSVINISAELVKSMQDLSNSIYKEIMTITNIESDINNGAASSSQPNTINGPPPFIPPK